MLIIKLGAPLGNYANDVPQTTYISGNIWLEVNLYRAASKARLHTKCLGTVREEEALSEGIMYFGMWLYKNK